MELKDLTTEELNILKEFKDSPVYKILDKWIKGHALSDVESLMRKIKHSNADEGVRVLLLATGEFEGAKNLLKLADIANDRLLNIKKKEHGAKDSNEKEAIIV